MFKRKKKLKPQHVHTLSLWEIIKRALEAKLPAIKLPASSGAGAQVSPPQNVTINHIAVVLDGRVEEIIRAQNRLSALLLSGPQFIEYDPEKDQPIIGETTYENGKFIHPESHNHEADNVTSIYQSKE